MTIKERTFKMTRMNFQNCDEIGIFSFIIPFSEKCPKEFYRFQIFLVLPRERQTSFLT